MTETRMTDEGLRRALESKRAPDGVARLMAAEILDRREAEAGFCEPCRMNRHGADCGGFSHGDCNCTCMPNQVRPEGTPMPRLPADCAQCPHPAVAYRVHDEITGQVTVVGSCGLHKRDDDIPISQAAPEPDHDHEHNTADCYGCEAVFSLGKRSVPVQPCDLPHLTDEDAAIVKAVRGRACTGCGLRLAASLVVTENRTLATRCANCHSINLESQIIARWTPEPDPAAIRAAIEEAASKLESLGAVDQARAVRATL